MPGFAGRQLFPVSLRSLRLEPRPTSTTATSTPHRGRSSWEFAFSFDHFCLENACGSFGCRAFLRNHRALMKRISAIALLLTFSFAQLLAWGPMGHAIIADLASSRLTPVTRQNLRLLLGDASLASVSSWADDVRKDRPETFGWHFVDIPKDAPGFSEERDCYRPQDKAPAAQTDHHNCIVDRIELFRQVL